MFLRDDQPLGLGVVLLSSLALAAGCSFDQGQPPSPDCAGINCDAGLELDSEEEPAPQFDAAPAPPPAVPDAGEPPICPGNCLPDDVLECADFSLESGQPESSELIFGVSGLTNSTDAAVARSDASADIGALAPSSADASTLADGGPRSGAASADASGFDTGSDGSAPFVPVEVDASVMVPPMPEETYSCQMVPRLDGLFAGCALAGRGVDRDPCSSSNDCAAGLGCVGRPGAGRCLPYCCEGAAVCAPGRICSQRPLLSSDNVEELLTIPVCAPPDQCDLMDPYPCPEGQNCSCGPNHACAAVGTDGARACVQPGEGRDGEECPCAAGYFCSPNQNQCIKQCQFGTDVCGANAICQAVRGFPENWGLCVALPPVADE